MLHSEIYAVCSCSAKFICLKNINIKCITVDSAVVDGEWVRRFPLIQERRNPRFQQRFA